MPISTRLAPVPAAGPAALAAHLPAPGGERHGPGLVVVAAADADGAGVDSLLGAPAGEVAAACGAGHDAGDLVVVAARPGSGVDGVAFLGLGDCSPDAMRKAGAAVGRRAAAGGDVLTPVAWGRPGVSVRAFAEGVLLGSYRFPAAPGEVPPFPATRLLVAEEGEAAGAVEQAGAIAGAVALARDLTNTPPARKSPAWLADEAAAVSEAAGLRARVWDERELARQGFGGLLAVGSGSARPPRLIQLGYSPPGAHGHVVLAGKGITFDSGGLSLKPTDGMKLMKTDMAGGAVVIAVMSALAGLGVATRVTGLVAAAENMPSGSAMRPGDVITHFGGRTDEVLNTDAEGRLVLADALAYAGQVLAPDVMVDIATLTGAARVALGARTGALYANDDALAGALLAAGLESGDPLWRMPLVEDYRDGLRSGVADLAHMARGGRARAGSIDAALFLREFTGGRPWAHLDIAGAARSGADDGEYTKGATGFGTRLLLRWLAAGAAPIRA